ncbi:ring-opening amidohydrolase [Rhodoferax sp.]|uniref:cyanuric acid amidohydrolase n=1 Tax=Rhodoferax sp. TaxID=50421 RepID=UPI0025DD5B81|nr:ring-opening amidohydrolase [Rhodoferax sp.]
MSAQVQYIDVHRVLCSGPGDLGGVQALVDSGALRPADIVAVMGKTEGNGCVNDFTRDFAVTRWCDFLSPHLGCSPSEVGQRVALVMSGGTEGVLSPHFTVFSRRWVTAEPQKLGKRLVVGVAHTRDFLPEEIGRSAQIECTAVAVREAMHDASIADAADVHFVQIKCPLLTSTKVHAALQRGARPVTHDSYESMAYSRGASALGVALALGEIPPPVDAAALLSDWSLYSARASASAGIELEANVVIVLGEAEGAASPYRIAHTVMRDAVDAASVRRMLHAALELGGDGVSVLPGLVNLLAKAEASPDGQVRGARHTMLNDSDINATRHARAAVGAVLASVVGDTALYVSGGAEHQGPAGGGPVAAIVRVGPLGDAGLPAL